MRGSGGFAASARIAALAAMVVAGSGCGRSSMLGSDGSDCPPGAHCVPADMARVDGGRDMSLDMRPSDMLDMRPSDMRGDMRPGDMRPTDMRPSDMRPTDMRGDGGNP